LERKIVKTRRNLIQIWLLCAALSTLNLQPSTAFAQPVTKVAGGEFHSLFLKSDGSLWAMGDNSINLSGASSGGQLGDGTYNNTNRPEQIVASNVTAIAAGSGHSLFLKSDGSLWAMGFNGFGQLGDGTHGSGPWFTTNQPEQIVASNVTAIAGGFWHSLFLKSDGSLWAMGWNYDGQLGDGTFNTTNQPEQIVASNVTAIAAGGYHSLFLKSDGSLWAMGSDYYGQLGDGTYGIGYPNNGTNRPEQIVASNVTALAAGYWHSLFLKSDGSLWAMGDNEYGQLGDGTYNDTSLPERIVASNITAIAGGGYHSLFLKSDGSLWAMGYNNYGQLGDGTYDIAYPGGTNRPEQIVAGPPGYGYNQMSIQLLSGGAVCSYFGGMTGTNYALDRTFSLSPPAWVPQVTNPANVFGVAVFTNTPDPTTNNFWRIRSVP
jgi:alpha-tubulin suppressor-like RCC1 family protein